MCKATKQSSLSFLFFLSSLVKYLIRGLEDAFSSLSLHYSPIAKWSAAEQGLCCIFPTRQTGQRGRRACALAPEGEEGEAPALLLVFCVHALSQPKAVKTHHKKKKKKKKGPTERKRSSAIRGF